MTKKIAIADKPSVAADLARNAVYAHPSGR